jgi:hypothetical protein
MNGDRRATVPRRRLSIIVVMMVIVMVITVSDDAPDATHDAPGYAARYTADDRANRARRTSALCCASFAAPYNALSLSC